MTRVAKGLLFVQRQLGMIRIGAALLVKRIRQAWAPGLDDDEAAWVTPVDLPPLSTAARNATTARPPKLPDARD